MCRASTVQRFRAIFLHHRHASARSTQAAGVRVRAPAARAAPAASTVEGGDDEGGGGGVDGGSFAGGVACRGVHDFALAVGGPE